MARVQAGPQVEVRAVCPRCWDERYSSDGVDGQTIYRKCLVCGHRGKVVRWRNDEVDAVIVK
jgi:hypothetical protein